MSHIVEFITIFAPFKRLLVASEYAHYTKRVREFVNWHFDDLGMHGTQYELLIVRREPDADISDALQLEGISYSIQFHDSRDAFVYKLKNKHSIETLEEMYVSWLMVYTNPCDETELSKAQTCVLGE
jgi:hypothetical protein